MNIKIRSEGVELLLEKLESFQDDEVLDESEIREIIGHPDIEKWLKAYDWIGNSRSKFENMLYSLYKEPQEDLELNLWGKKIQWGLKKAIEEPSQMREDLQEIKNYGRGSTLKKVMRYLPEGTIFEPTFIVTIDGFNGGMFREDTVYLSLVYFDRSHMGEDLFAHEFHHMGVDQWLEKDPIIQKYRDAEDECKKYFVELFTYLVGEGLANAYCSPQAIRKISERGEEAKRHNEMVERYEEKKEELFNRLEGLVESIVNEKEEDLAEEYSEFTMDKQGRGLPPGHFLSGRMVQTMAESSEIPQEKIVGLVRDPFDFLSLYNKAAKDLDARSMSEELVEKTERYLKDLE